MRWLSITTKEDMMSKKKTKIYHSNELKVHKENGTTYYSMVKDINKFELHGALRGVIMIMAENGRMEIQPAWEDMVSIKSEGVSTIGHTIHDDFVHLDRELTLYAPKYDPQSFKVYESEKETILSYPETSTNCDPMLTKTDDGYMVNKDGLLAVHDDTLEVKEGDTLILEGGDWKVTKSESLWTYFAEDETYVINKDGEYTTDAGVFYFKKGDSCTSEPISVCVDYPNVGMATAIDGQEIEERTSVVMLNNQILR